MTSRVRAGRETPVWVKAMVALVLVGGPGWWIATTHDRHVNQSRLARIASQIAGREVGVRCPGVLGRVGSNFDTAAGTVQFDADGNPADKTKLRQKPCAELDALAEGRRGEQLACVERSTSCGDDAQAVAHAVDTVTHESCHLAGVIDEAVTECFALQTMAWTAQQLGVTAAQARGLARLEWETTYTQLPDQYRTGDCADGRKLDRRPDDPSWP